MSLNLNDPDSIVRWWEALPQRHDSYLDFRLKVSPEFADSINEARRRIASNPELRVRPEQAAAVQRQLQAVNLEHAIDLDLPLPELRWRVRWKGLSAA